MIAKKHADAPPRPGPWGACPTFPLPLLRYCSTWRQRRDLCIFESSCHPYYQFNYSI